jgi:hypothetical protein
MALTGHAGRATDWRTQPMGQSLISQKIAVVQIDQSCYVIANKGCYSAPEWLMKLVRREIDTRSEAIGFPEALPAKRELNTPLAEYEPPQLVLDAGQFATFAYAEFFSTRSGHTRTAYRRNVDRFLDWLSSSGLTWHDVSAPVLAEYLDKHVTIQRPDPASASWSSQTFGVAAAMCGNWSGGHGGSRPMPPTFSSFGGRVCKGAS